MKIILGGHWTTPRAGWRVLREADQDITQPLACPDGSIEAIFTEHVIEHVSLAGAIAFFREVHRVLIPGGHCRTVFPALDIYGTLTRHSPEIVRHYAHTALVREFVSEEAALATLGLSIADYPVPFSVSNLVRGHGHRTVWTTGLLVGILQRLGFARVEVAAIGHGVIPAHCLEQPQRIASPQPDWGICDLESGAVDALR